MPELPKLSLRFQEVLVLLTVSVKLLPSSALTLFPSFCGSAGVGPGERAGREPDAGGLQREQRRPATVRQHQRPGAEAQRHAGRKHPERTDGANAAAGKR